MSPRLVKQGNERVEQGTGSPPGNGRNRPRLPQAEPVEFVERSDRPNLIDLVDGQQALPAPAAQHGPHLLVEIGQTRGRIAEKNRYIRLGQCLGRLRAHGRG